jgi:2-octaprenyl-6-methoxyphenol hydroxylase
MHSTAFADASEYDLVIVGGGMVGASLALALARTPVRVAVIEPVLPDAGTAAGAQPSFDDRTSALSNGTRRILETIGAWAGIAPGACAIRQIRVSDAGHFGAARLDAGKLGLPAIGYTVSNRVIGSALWEALRGASSGGHVHLFAPATVSAVEIGDEWARLSVSRGGAAAGSSAGAALTLRTRLVVAADGAKSLVRSTAGIEAEVIDYQQVAIVASLAASTAANGIAYERFTPHGPIALLPRHDGSYTIVWTVATDEAATVLALSDGEFCGALQQRFGWRVGQFTRAGARASYPLALTRANATTAARTALVGNAAQGLHPVAGQGFNLGLRDAAVLAELVAAAKQGESRAGAGAADGADGANGATSDVGTRALLSEYARRRSADRDGMIQFTDGLVRGFALEQPGAAQLRSLGLMLFDAAPPLKQTLSRISWGFGGRAPRLLRGLPLA